MPALLVRKAECQYRQYIIAHVRYEHIEAVLVQRRRVELGHLQPARLVGRIAAVIRHPYPVAKTTRDHGCWRGDRCDATVARKSTKLAFLLRRTSA
jgi:hypothetical protein